MMVIIHDMGTIILQALQDNQQMLFKFDVKMKDVQAVSMCMTPIKAIYIYIYIS
jgi:hypothetical protein